MSVTIAMPRMSTDPELTTAQSKYVESLARAGAKYRYFHLCLPLPYIRCIRQYTLTV